MEYENKFASNSIPMFGKFTFNPSDVDVLYYHITGEEYQNHEIN